MGGIGVAARAFSGPTSIGAAQTIATRTDLQAAARAIVERRGSVLTRALNQSQAIRDASALGLTGGIGTAAMASSADSIWGKGIGAAMRTNAMVPPGALNSVIAGQQATGMTALANSIQATRIPQLPKLWDGMPSATVRSALNPMGTTKAFGAIEAIERRMARGGWDAPQGSQGPMIDLPPPPPPRERLTAELNGLRRAATEAGEAIAADRRAQVKRDEEMVRAMQAMEAALVESAEREAASLKRAEEAEAREVAAQARSEELDARMVKLTVLLVALTCVSVIAGVVAVIAALA